MAKRRVEPAPVERKNRVMLSFSDRDYVSLAKEAKEAKLPIATYARLLILRRQVAPVASQASGLAR
ncbi:MAG TPA: hypothetical protein VK550_12420 [Polyangiaceae bacterium]|nr:hypothetical protein [Polyangiaceae bacterium]